MELSTSELIKQIHQYNQDEYNKRLLNFCAVKLKEQGERINQLEGVSSMLRDYIDCAAEGYPSECRKILDNIMEVLDGDNERVL